MRSDIPVASSSSRLAATEHRLLLGDARAVLQQLPSGSADLIVTSPPYADARKASYGGVAPERYVEWFLPVSERLLRVLKPSGTFTLNIKERCQDGERHPYVLELILALRAQGWRWTEEFVWHKKQCYPGYWPNRFRDAWERLLQFNKAKGFAMYQEAVKVPAQASTVARGQHGDYRVPHRTGSGLTPCRQASAAASGKTLPSNVLHLAAETRNRGHGAAFPEPLPAWFIQLFTQPGDLVLDPFTGSGTTNVAADRLGRNSIGIDIMPEHIAVARRRLAAERCPRRQRRRT